MSAPSSNPYVTPPVPETTYPLMWLSKLLVECEGFNSARITANLMPYRNVDSVSQLPTPPLVKAWADYDLFTLHVRQPYVEQAMRARLTAFGITVPDGVPANLFLVDVIANCVVAASEAVDPNAG